MFVLSIRRTYVRKEEIKYILLACCTCLRPEMLYFCLTSIKELILPENTKIEILVVDNDRNKTGFGVVNDFENDSGFKCHYIVEEKRGLCYARNRLLAEAMNLGASHVMLFDDDELFTPDALVMHIDLCSKYDSPLISSGVVVNKFIENTPNYVKKNIVFKQKTTKKTGLVKNTCAGGNVFFPVEMLENNNLRFSEEYVFMGGEDGNFFAKASSCGYTIIQNSESILYEVVTEARANVNYILKKAYYNGFAGSYFKFKNKRKTIGKVFYVTRQIITLLFDFLLMFPALICGLTGFVNFLSRGIRAIGKIVGVFSTKPIEFYKKIYGG